MSNEISQLDAVMAQADLAIRCQWKEILSCEIIWVIEEFEKNILNRCGIGNWDDDLTATEKSIVLPDKSEPTVVRLAWLPCANVYRQYSVKAEITWRPSLGNWNTEYGQLDKDGSPVPWPLDPYFPYPKPYFSREELLKKREQLLPDGRLIFYAKLTHKSKPTKMIGSIIQPRPLRQQQQSRENPYKDMVEQQFVDLGGSALLVFEDGEQQCHSFPLAAR
jgi:hypothetical protein